MASRRTLTKEDLAIVESITSGEKPYRQIAEEHGLSPAAISQIIAGKRRKYLQPIIRMRQRERQMAATNLATRWLGGVMGKHIREGVTGTGETARKCREYVMKHALLDVDNVDSPKAKVKTVAAMIELSPGLKRQVLKELGGPTLTDLSSNDGDL